MTNLIWTLDNEGRLTATWDTPPAPEPFAARWAVGNSDRRVVRSRVRARTPPHRISRAAALAAYFRIQASLIRRSVA